MSDSGRLTIALALSLLLHVMLMVYVRFAQPSAQKPPSLTTLKVTLAKKPAEMPVVEKPAVVAETVAPPEIPPATRKSVGKAKIGVQSATPVISPEPARIAPKPKRKRKPKVKRKIEPAPQPRKERILATNKPSELTVAKALTEAPAPKPPVVPEEPIKPAEPPPSVANPAAGAQPPVKHPTKIVAVQPPPEEKPLPPPEPRVEEPKPVKIEEPKPVKLEEPKPVIIDKPIVIEEAKPVMIEEPKPVKLEEPKPVKIEEPVQVDEPKPVKIEEPVKVDEPKPVKIEEPVKVEAPKPVKIEEPVKVEEPKPVKIEEPVAIEEPKPVKIEEAKPVSIEQSRPLKIEEPKPASSIFATKSNSSVFSAGKQDSGAARSSVFSGAVRDEWGSGSSRGLPRITTLKPPPGARRKVVGSKEQELRYITYRDSVVLKLQRVGQFNYPADAARKNQGGSLVLEFAIKPDGSVEEISITRPSPIDSLNKGAEKIVKLCSPFSPLPESIRQDTDILIVRINWTFTNLRQQFD